jgi:hypothetical protein
MLENYGKQLAIIATIFGLLSYTVYVCAESIMMKPVVIKVAKKSTANPAKKEVAKPAKKAEEPKKDPNRKKPTLKKKYADKK